MNLTRMSRRELESLREILRTESVGGGEPGEVEAAMNKELISKINEELRSR
jgi:hypothetical protein